MRRNRLYLCLMFDICIVKCIFEMQIALCNIKHICAIVICVYMEEAIVERLGKLETLIAQFGVTIL